MTINIASRYMRTEVIQIDDSFGIYKDEYPGLFAMTEEELTLWLRSQIQNTLPNAKYGNFDRIVVKISEGKEGLYKRIMVSATITVHVSGSDETDLFAL